MEETLVKHMADDSKFQGKIDRVLFGDAETGEMGMKQKMDTMYEILVQAKGLGGFLKNFQNGITLLLALGALVAWLKGWIKL